MNLAPAAAPARPRICFLAYTHIARLAAPIIAEYVHKAEIEVVEASFDAALSIARERVRAGATDVFISAGANAALLRRNIEMPVAIVQLDGFSLLQALIRARAEAPRAPRVGVVMYGRTIPELDAIKDLLKLEVVQYAYEQPDEARRCCQRLKDAGFEVIVGSSVVVEIAEQQGLHGILAYSQAGVRRGFDDAIELARVTRLESGRYQQLNSVLGNLQDAVLAVDRHDCVSAINPRMQTLLAGQGPSLGRPLAAMAPELSLLPTMASGAQERALVLRFAGRDWIANRTPIREHGAIVGAALTLYDAQAIAEADTSLRIVQRKRQVAAKYSFDDLIGASSPFQRAVHTARRFAATDLTVLIAGESGSGKELFAQAIHNAGARAAQPFVALNCAAFPEALLESELFGYEEGAFTGSRRGGKRGLFETAHTGTLFLDEIGDMPLSLQTRLLRVLQEREIIRVGGVVPIPVDVRVIAATHQPLQQMMAERRFRQDLYYRINTLRLSLPPLRARPDDVAALAQVLVGRSLARLGSAFDAACVLAPLLPRLVAYGWLGNVRELENIADRIAVHLLQFEPGDDVGWDGLREDCPELFQAVPEEAFDDGDLKARLLRELERNHGNRTLAAQQLGISRSTLWRKLRKLHEQPPRPDGDGSGR